MRATQIAVRAAFVCAAAGITLAAWSATEDTAAHAADHPPAAVEQPGGLLDHLPQQASDRAKQVVDQVVPDTTPTAKPKPKAHKPKPPAVEPEPTEPAEPKPREDIELPPLVPVIDEPAPAPAPEPQPDNGDVVALPVPPAAVLPAPVIAPGWLPIIEPIPAAEPPTGIVAQLVTALTAGEQDLAADCADDPRDARRVDRDAIRALLAILDGELAPAVQRAARSDSPCDPGGGQDYADHLAAVPAPNQSGGGQFATVPTRTGLPAATERLGQLLPRSDLPASRTSRLDPRPA